MRRRAIWAHLVLLGCSIGAGCGGAPEPPSAGLATTNPVAATPATLPNEGDAAEKRARIASMYAGYRTDAFADAGEIEAAALPLAGASKPIVLIDCREDRERAVSTIDGAISKAEFESDPARYRDRVIVTYCTIGYRSGVYAQALADRGFDARNLVGGVLAWAHDGRSFVDENGNATNRVHVYGAEWDLLPMNYLGVYEGKSPP